MRRDPELGAVVARARAAMAEVRRCIALLEADAPTTLGSLAGLAQARDEFRGHLGEAAGLWRRADRLVVRVRDGAKLDLPPLDEALDAAGCGLFRALLARDWARLGLGPTSRGRTLLAPDDAAFLGQPEVNWEEACWGLHVVEVPLLVSDMANYPGGKVQPLDQTPKHALRVRNEEGNFTLCVLGDPPPPRKAFFLRKDVKVEGGIILHIIDRIMYPPL